MTIYGTIEAEKWWGDEVTPKEFKKDIDVLGDITTLNIYINSPGGDVFAGQAIYSILKRKKCTINTYVDGLAASAASIIAMAGDNVYMPINALLMIHNAWTWGCGNSNDFRKIADDLEKINLSIIAVYAEKTGLSEEKIKEMMDAETWLTAQEAFDLGFANKIEEEKQVAASLKNGVFCFNGVEMDLSKYRNTPKVIIGKVEEPKEPPKNQFSEIESQLQILKIKNKKYKF